MLLFMIRSSAVWCIPVPGRADAAKNRVSANADALELRRLIVYHFPFRFRSWQQRDAMYLDTACIALIGVCALIGLVNGLGAELVSWLASATAAVGVYLVRHWIGGTFMTWLHNRFPQTHFDTVLARFTALIATFFILYLLVSAALDAVRLRVEGNEKPNLLWRLYGLCAGAVKGVALLIVVVWLVDASRPTAARLVGEHNYARYSAALDRAYAVAASRAAADALRTRCGLAGTLMGNVEDAFAAAIAVTNTVVAP
jgi:uncharacterized membrane protein required for colicin V production